MEEGVIVKWHVQPGRDHPEGRRSSSRSRPTRRPWRSRPPTPAGWRASSWRKAAAARCCSRWRTWRTTMPMSMPSSPRRAEARQPAAGASAALRPSGCDEAGRGGVGPGRHHRDRPREGLPGRPQDRRRARGGPGDGRARVRPGRTHPLHRYSRGRRRRNPPCCRGAGPPGRIAGRGGPQADERHAQGHRPQPDAFQDHDSALVHHARASTPGR